MILAPQTRRRNLVGLTPMIDVVFLLLIFFILAARFGTEQVVDLTLGAGADTAGPPRIVDVGADFVRLNGIETGLPELAGALAGLGVGPEDVIVLRAGDGADLQRAMTVIDVLREADFVALALAALR